ncbi:MAG: hypothetical protein AB8G22_21135 [Saprospiraceae bacterium]
MEYIKNPDAEKFKGKFEEQIELDTDHIPGLFDEVEYLAAENKKLKR